MRFQEKMNKRLTHDCELRYMQTYRSGHIENDSKCCESVGTVIAESALLERVCRILEVCFFSEF